MFVDGLLADLSDSPITFPPIKQGLEVRSFPVRNDKTQMKLIIQNWGRFTSFTQFLVTKMRFVTGRETESSTQCQKAHF
jgi:hypothetical protein